MATTEPLVVYPPWYVLQPENPATVRSRKTAVISVPASGTETALGEGAYPSTIHDPSSGLAGAASKTSRIDRSAPRIVRVSFRTL